MNKLAFSDMRHNLKLFFGTFMAILVTSCIVSTCLNLVFSSTAEFSYGHRFDSVQVSAVANQNVVITYTEADGDLDEDSRQSEGRIPFSTEQLLKLKSQYDIIEDYTFFIQAPELSGKKVAGHNYSSMDLSGFTVRGEEPSVNQVVIDEELAEENSLEIGDILTINTNQGMLKCEISGIALNKTKDVYDIQNYIFFSDDTAKEYAIGCVSIGIVSGNSQAIAEELEEEGYKAYTGSDINKAELSEMINRDISLMVIFITMGAVCLVISLFVIGGTVQFSIKNRFRTLAQLRVIGLKKGQVKYYLSIQTAVIAFMASAIGSLAGIPTAKLIISGYQYFGIVASDFMVTHSWMWDGVVILSIMVLSVMVTRITANKPLSVPPASAMKDEGEFIGKTTFVGILCGIVLLLGGIAIVVFAPMTLGIGIGMGFCACSLLLAGAMCLTPVIMKIFNALFSLIVKRFKKSLGNVANANISMKASKFAVAAVSIAIMMSMGSVMVLNNYTYMQTVIQAKASPSYNFVSSGKYLYELPTDEVMGTKSAKLIFGRGKSLINVNALAVYGSIPDVTVIEKQADISDDTVWISDSLRGFEIGDKVECWLEDGTKTSFTIGGIYEASGNVEESYVCIVDYKTIQHSFYDKHLDTVYTMMELENSIPNTEEAYRSSPSYDIQLGATMMLGAIGLILSVVALFNTFSVIMSVRKKEFNNLKVIGANKTQIFKMTLIETLITTVTGLIIGFGILATCVGAYSLANTGVFDYIVNSTVFWGTTAGAGILGLVAGTLSSFLTIRKLKRKFRVE